MNNDYNKNDENINEENINDERVERNSSPAEEENVVNESSETRSTQSSNFEYNVPQRELPPAMPPEITNGEYHYSFKEPQAPKKEKKKNSSSGKLMALMLAGCLIISSLSGFGGVIVGRQLAANSGEYTVTEKETDSSGAVIYKTANVAANTGVTSVGSEAIVNVAESAAPAVVEITTESLVTNNYFGQYVQSGAGSGVIITENGYIITCAHVIDGSTTITVKLTDGTLYDAKIIGSDSVTDIAVLKIEAEGLVYAVMGDSDTLKVGSDVVAIGNPLGKLGGSVTNGIISALDREVEIEEQKYNLLQTNAAINPGNSGGGLFNINGELIGIVNAKSSGSGIEGLSFAIPINDATAIAEQLIDFGYIKGRPQLGIHISEITSTTDLMNLRSTKYAALINYITEYGVYFIEYNPNSGQVEGDLQFGDRFVAINGIEVTSLSNIQSLLNSEFTVGEEITVTVARITNSKTLRSEMVNVKITLVESVPEK